MLKCKQVNMAVISDQFSPGNPVADGLLKNRGVFVLAMTQLSGRALGPVIPPVVLEANLLIRLNETPRVKVRVNSHRILIKPLTELWLCFCAI